MNLAPAAPAAPAAALDAGLGVRRRATLAGIAVLVVASFAIGVALLLQVPSGRTARAAYNAATPYRCGHRTPPAGVSCWEGVDGRIVGLAIDHGRLGGRRSVLTVATSGGNLDVPVEAAPALDCVTGGEPVVVRRLDGAVTTVFTPSGTLPTAANPNVDADAELQGGLALLAVSLIVPAGIVLATIRSRRRGRVEFFDVYRPTVMRLALLAFVAGQAADVVTSAVGQAVGLSEGNAIVDVFVRAVGPLGFLLFRLPAIILVVLGLTQVPRRIAVATLLGMGAIFTAVGVHNAVLAATAGASCVTGALP